MNNHALSPTIHKPVQYITKYTFVHIAWQLLSIFLIICFSSF